MNNSIILVEDDPELGELIIDYLQQHQCSVKHYLSAAKADSAIKQQHQKTDVIILDIMLPDGNGLDICKSVRQYSNVPIIILTARGDTTDKVIGLELGADDYLAKPFEPRELLARLKALMRRSRTSASTISILHFGELAIDTKKRVVKLGEKLCELTSYQFDLLRYLAENAGNVMSRESIMDHLKQQQLEAFDRSIDVHISRIRAQIESDPKSPQRIKTIRGIGYVFEKNDDE